MQVLLKRAGIRLPEPDVNEMRYVVADNGIFVERNTPLFDSSAQIDKFDLRLDDHRQYCRLFFGAIPRVMQRAMLGFFTYAHQVHGGEAALVLLYHPEMRRFRWYCPPQTVEIYRSWGRWVALDKIEFQNPLDLPDGFLLLGDAHLHPGAPNPSAIDLADDQDGLHIIVGNIESTPCYNVDFVVDRVRFRVPEELIFEDLHCPPFPRPPERWLRQIRLRRSGDGGQNQLPIYTTRHEPLG